MKRLRLVAALASLVTVLLLQASVIAPVTVPYPVSLPAVLVAAVALVDGPAAGMAFGFAVGLVADLGSHHPAGVLALAWLAVGLLAGKLAHRGRLRRDIAVAALVSGLGGVVGGVLLVVVRSGGSSLRTVLVDTPAGLLGDLVLAVLIVPLVRRMLRSEALRAPQAAYTELVLGAPRA